MNYLSTGAGFLSSTVSDDLAGCQFMCVLKTFVQRFFGRFLLLHIDTMCFVRSRILGCQAWRKHPTLQHTKRPERFSHQFGDSSVVSPWKNCRNCAMNPQDFPPKILPKVWLVNWISPRERYEPGCCYFAGHSSLYPRRSEGHPGVRRSKNLSGYFGSHLYMSHVWIL